jgi:hypothetical protein
MLLAVITVIALVYLPGALIFRLPVGDRPRRAALPAEERAYWAIILSVSLSTLAGLALAAAGVYTRGRLVAIAAIASALIVAKWRFRLRLDATAPAPGRTVLVPLGLVLFGLCFFFPSSEYVIGGKDPGTYVNEGVQIAHSRSLTIPDRVVADVPAAARDLFIGSSHGGYDEGLQEGPRFMGFFVLSRDRGEVVGQFPHGFPLWIAIGYVIDGVRGALGTVGVWALLGLLGVYFTGARLLGRLPAAVGCALLTVNVAEIWFARYPNSEMMQQALLFAGILATAHAYGDRDRFFAPVAGLLLSSLIFVRFDTIIIVAIACGALLIWAADGVQLGLSFLAPFFGLLGASAVYYETLMKAYIVIALVWVSGNGMSTDGEQRLVMLAAGFLAAVAILRAVRARWPGVLGLVKPWIPRALAVAVPLLWAYAFFLRQPGGLLAAHDAHALRSFTWYVGSVGLAAAVFGFSVTTWRSFWRDPVFLTTSALVSAFFFYKIRIVPEHFWQARRWIPIILPATCLMIAAGALTPFQSWLARAGAGGFGWRRRWPEAGRRLALPAAIVVFVGWQFLAIAAPVIPHVEYQGIVSQLEALVGQIGDRDLVVVEPRSASDAYVLATPLAYIYRKNVLALYTPRPDPELFAQFLAWAGHHYNRVLFLADGGTDLALPYVKAAPVYFNRFEVPEYESAYDAFPREVRRKKFALTLYTLQYTTTTPTVTDIDVGGADNLWVLRIHARELSEGVSFRWTRNISYVSVQGMAAGSRAVTLWMSDGGRPAAAGEARVQVLLNDHVLGTVTVSGPFRPYELVIPPDVAAEAARRTPASVFKIISTTWRPSALLGNSDTREIGVMLQRLRVN